MIPFRKHSGKLVLTVLSMLILASCNRTIPAASMEQLKEKKSVLLITAASVSKEENDQIGSTLQTEAMANKIAFEWVNQATEFDKTLSERTAAKPYDRVLVVGEELFEGAVEAAKTDTTKRFSLFQANHNLVPASVPDLANLRLNGLDGNRFIAEWDGWVKTQRELGSNILWINRTQAPVPAQWAPSEEADMIFTIDQFPDNEWFSQLSYQTRNIQANWIVLYSSVDSAIVNRIKTLRLPLLDMNGGLSVSYAWDGIIKEELRKTKSEEWKSGTVVYTDQEAQVIRK